MLRNRIAFVCQLCVPRSSSLSFVCMSICAADEKDAAEFDKPNLATQAELGTYTFNYQYFPFQTHLEFAADWVVINRLFYILQLKTGRLFSSGGTPDVPAKRPSTGVQNTPGEYQRATPPHLTHSRCVLFCWSPLQYHHLFASVFRMISNWFLCVFLICCVFILDTSASSKWSQCQFCKLVITTVNLWRHIRTQHTDQPPLQCEYCQKSFKNKYSKREHIRKSHFSRFLPVQEPQTWTNWHFLVKINWSISLWFCSWTGDRAAFRLLCESMRPQNEK